MFSHEATGTKVLWFSNEADALVSQAWYCRAGYKRVEIECIEGKRWIITVYAQAGEG